MMDEMMRSQRERRSLYLNSMGGTIILKKNRLCRRDIEDCERKFDGTLCSQQRVMCFEYLRAYRTRSVTPGQHLDTVQPRHYHDRESSLKLSQQSERMAERGEGVCASCGRSREGGNKSLGRVD
ncbi:hypothetical protein EVAR_68744_1 [Eumeta japonica]|uniref:Uncharacterized protein n=1 Tax=Eumeta variegata TaxID=151549 RepID=A0A4C1ZJ18_EUMVA|nr:hypothetical protein EVAR_68744_1 [Eumeta japonica]